MSNLTPEQVKDTFNRCYKIYKDNIDNELFKIIISNMFATDMKSFTDVMSTEYKMYDKYKSAWSDTEWADLINEARQIQVKYPESDFVAVVNNGVLDIIERTFKSKK